jgi:hypothetical protein
MHAATTSGSETSSRQHPRARQCFLRGETSRGAAISSPRPEWVILGLAITTGPSNCSTAPAAPLRLPGTRHAVVIEVEVLELHRLQPHFPKPAERITTSSCCRQSSARFRTLYTLQAVSSGTFHMDISRRVAWSRQAAVRPTIAKGHHAPPDCRGSRPSTSQCRSSTETFTGTCRREVPRRSLVGIACLDLSVRFSPPPPIRIGGRPAAGFVAIGPRELVLASQLAGPSLQSAFTTWIDSSAGRTAPSPAGTGCLARCSASFSQRPSP